MIEKEIRIKLAAVLLCNILLVGCLIEKELGVSITFATDLIFNMQLPN